MSCYIFLSYSTTNKELAGTIHDELEQCGISTFLAHHDIEPSSVWKRNIVSELKECKIFMPLITSEFKGSAWTDQECGIAFALDKDIMPIKVDDNNPYGFLSDYQAVSLRGVNGYYYYNDLFKQIAWKVFNKANKGIKVQI